jgi:DNA-binding transcriptional LysR family regulator
VDVHHLEVFASVYKNRSFSRASEELNLTQPTVSEHVRRLEEELGVRLFDRVGRRTIPTRDAELLNARAEEIIQKLRDIKTDLGGQEREVKGLITVGTSATPGSYIIPPLAAGFRKKYPEVFFQVMMEDSPRIADLVVGGELLLGVVGEKTKHEMLEYLAGIEDELVLAAPPGFLKKKAITPMELMGVPFLMWNEGSEMHKSMRKGHTERGVSLKGLNVAAILGSTDSVREAVKAGLGVSILSRLAIKDDLKAGRIEEVKLKGVRMMQSYFVIAHRKRTLPAHYLAFLEFLKEKLSPLKPDSP